MMTLLASLLGFFGSMFPEALKLLREAADRKHELTLLSMQMEQEKMGYANRLEEIRIGADKAESNAIYKTFYSGIKWVDAFNASVRPALAYSFFLLYAIVKLSQLYISGSPIILLWTEDDQAIFAGIISFYFGQRSISKLRK